MSRAQGRIKLGRRFQDNIEGTRNGAACGLVREGLAPSRNGGSGVVPLENFENFISQTVHFVEYLCHNWSTEWVHFAVSNTGFRCF